MTKEYFTKAPVMTLVYSVSLKNDFSTVKPTPTPTGCLHQVSIPASSVFASSMPP